MIALRAHRHWIPPLPLAAGMAFQCIAWILVLVHAVAPSFGVELAWVHAVALGWLTSVALAVLLHVIPAFTDLAWRGEQLARALVVAVPILALALVVSFALGSSHTLVAAGTALALAVLAYVTLAMRTLAQPAADSESATIARGLIGPQAALALTAVLGGLLVVGYAGDPALLRAAPSHALLGTAGWLTLLTSGVSLRTFRPMLGARSRWTIAHIAAHVAMLGGVVVAAAAAPWSAAWFRAGVLVGAAGALIYAADTFDVVRRASSPHHAARAFVAAASTWLAVATVLTVATSWGSPLGSAAIVVALAGWLGQMVNAHLHHLGVRVVSTLVLGDDDETRPWELLTPALTWSAFATAQIAVAGTALRSLGAPSPVAWLAGCAGLLCIGCIAANGTSVLRRLTVL